MKEIVFMVSDASFKNDKTAILAVKDMYTEKLKQKVVSIKIQSSLRAEELALRYAIDLAISEEYRHVVFVYDCLAINTDKFKKRYQKFFETMQFLWLHRKHIADIDKLTKKVEDEAVIAIRDIPEEERDKLLINILSKYVATEKEAIVFSKLKRRDYKITKNKRSSLFSLTYFLLSNNGKKLFKRYLRDHLNSEELNKTFRHKHRKEYFGLMKQLNIKEEIISNILKAKRGRR